MSSVPDSLAEAPGDVYAELEARMGLYRLLGRLLSREVDQALLEQMRRKPLSDALSDLGICLDELYGDDERVLEELSVEFTRLFLGPGRHISPHESMHVGSDGALNDATTVQVRRFILVAGFELREGSGRYPNHLATELEFMESLVARQIEALRGGDPEEAETSRMLQQEFVRLHLKRWIPAFCAKVQHEANMPFYATLATALSEFIRMECAELDA